MTQIESSLLTAESWVKCKTTNQRFKNVHQAAKALIIDDLAYKERKALIQLALDRRIRSARGFVFVYCEPPVKRSKPRPTVRLQCIENQRFFPSGKLAAKWAKVTPTKLSQHLNSDKPEKLNGWTFRYADSVIPRVQPVYDLFGVRIDG